MFLRRCAGITSLISYARVSSADQDPALQLDALHAAGCARVFTDNASGALARRPQLDAALDYARGGDVLVVWRLDRLGRSLRHLVDLVEDMVAREIGLRSLAEGIRNMPRVPRVFCGVHNPRTWAFWFELGWFWHLTLFRVFLKVYRLGRSSCWLGEAEGARVEFWLWYEMGCR